MFTTAGIRKQHSHRNFSIKWWEKVNAKQRLLFKSANVFCLPWGFPFDTPANLTHRYRVA